MIYFSELEKYGIHLEIEMSPEIGDICESIDFIFGNHHISIEVHVTFYLSINKFNLLGALLLRINNKLNSEWFNIEDYFTQYKGVDYKDVPFDDRIYDTDNIEQQIDNYLKSVINVLQTELLDVITGKKWIHVPMDWYGAK